MKCSYLISIWTIFYFVNLSSAIDHYKVTSILAEPFLMVKADKSLKGNDRYEGFCKDLADMIAEKINITYELNLVRDGKFGQDWRSDGNWNGMIGEVQRGQEAQIGIAPITVTSARMKVVDFSTPFIEFQLGILMKSPEQIPDDDGDDDNDDDHGQFIFLRPMSFVLWILFIIAVVFTVGILYFIERFIANKIYEAKINAAMVNNLPALPPPVPIGVCVNGICGSPRTITGRLVQVIFWIFIVFFLAAYIATFAADRVVDRLDEDKEDLHENIKSIEDILEQDTIKLGVLRGGSSYDYFQKTQDRVYRKIFSLINNAKGFTDTSEEGIARVRNSNGSYAFIMESPSALATSMKKPCDVIMINDQFGPKKGYSVITHTQMPITRAINLAILELKDTDELEKLEEKWFEAKSECKSDKDDDNDDEDEEEEDHDPLCLADMAGLFYLLLIVVLVALGFAFLEIRHHSTTRSTPRNVEVPLRQT